MYNFFNSDENYVYYVVLTIVHSNRSILPRESNPAFYVYTIVLDI